MPWSMATGGSRLPWEIAFLGVNGLRLTMSNDEPYALIIEIATGDLDSVQAIADVLGRHTESRRR